MAPDTISLDRLNAALPGEFAALLAGIVEHAPEIAASVAAARPFATVTALHEAFMAVIAALPRAERIALVDRHPELAGKEAEAGAMTAESVSEQGSAGLDRLPAADVARLQALNRAYRARFGFPFMICVRRHTRGSIFAEAERRLARGPDEELDEALRQIRFVTRLRIVDRVHGPGLPPVAGELSAAVQDAAGRAVAGVPLSLVDLSEPGCEREVAFATTTAEGRRAPLVAGRLVPIGLYEIRATLAAGAPPADDTLPAVVPVRLRVADAEASHHVALSIAKDG